MANLLVPCGKWVPEPDAEGVLKLDCPLLSFSMTYCPGVQPFALVCLIWYCGNPQDSDQVGYSVYDQQVINGLTEEDVKLNVRKWQSEQMTKILLRLGGPKGFRFQGFFDG